MFFVPDSFFEVQLRVGETEAGSASVLAKRGRGGAAGPLPFYIPRN